MKKATLLFILSGLTLIVLSQENYVTKSTGGIETGFLGVWLYDEIRLTNVVALRGEIGLSSRIWNDKVVTAVNSGYYVALVLTLEPRFYYDLKSRYSKSKNISGNSGNFVSINIRYHPDWFIISNDDNPNNVNQLALIPTWGIKRNIGKHLTYEVGCGIGYEIYFTKKVGYRKNIDGVAFNYHLRIGYRF
ncbi:MAG: hypothetical protein ISR55_07375 [Bacteroidetes bacterium]|nr:hypothetical protein [Bacteroidota bacterium]MBL6963626.1 hypothetical protein [Bacteroidota bacterium]